MNDLYSNIENKINWCRIQTIVTPDFIFHSFLAFTVEWEQMLKIASLQYIFEPLQAIRYSYMFGET